MKNVSIEQLNKEVLTAKKQALSDPYRYERPDFVENRDGNSLIEIVQMKEQTNHSNKKTFPAAVRKSVDYIFDKFPNQLRILGLYYDGGFTIEEIADMDGTTKANISIGLSRAKARLKKYLSDEEYDSIRWAIGDPKKLEATQPRFVNPFYNDFVESQPVVLGKVLGHFEGDDNEFILWKSGEVEYPLKREVTGQHPPAKDLPKGSMYYEMKSIETGLILAH